VSNPFSWYPRYARDYAEKTAHLSLAEHGAYTLLLDHYMTFGGAIAIAIANGMPEPSVCYRICRAQTDQERAAVDSVVSQYFTLEDDGCLHNKRADIELGKRKNISETRASIGKAGADKRWKAAQGMANAMAIAMPNAMAIGIANGMANGMAKPMANGCTSTATSTIEDKTPLLFPPSGGHNTKVVSERKARATRLPEKWSPTTRHEELAAELGVEFFDEFLKFKDYFLAEGKTKVDWDRTFNNWLRTAAERKNNRGHWK